MVHRHLSRTASHRSALMRNLATSLIEKESIVTTWAKAKEAQSHVERMITMSKNKDPEKARSLVQGQIFNQGVTLPKIFGELSERYANREGGYTRVIRMEPRIDDQAEQAILELVDGKREAKFFLTARIVARLERQSLPLDPLTQNNVRQLLKFRKDGEQVFRETVEWMKTEFYSTSESIENLPPPITTQRSKRRHQGIKYLAKPEIAN